jgi:predicted DNA-binding transcriptional regulator AlpA
VAEAVTTYSSMLAWLSAAAAAPATESAQSTMWMENLLVRLCQLSDQSTATSGAIAPSDALRTYRYWAKFGDAPARTAGHGQAHDAPASARQRRLAWKAYYDSLSTILRHRLPYEPEPSPATAEKPPLHSQSSLRLRQRAELKRVETLYEALLIKETQFPKASETNHEVEAWVDSAIDNWRLLSGPTWSDADLGEGGKEGIARSVLDVRLALLSRRHASELTRVRSSTALQPRRSTRPRYCAISSLYTPPWPSLS